MIRAKVLRSGDGTHKFSKESDTENIPDNNNDVARDTEHFWGYGDKEMTEEDYKNIEILHKQFD